MSSMNLDAFWETLKNDLHQCNSEMEFPTMLVEDISTAEGMVRTGVNQSGQYLVLLPCDSTLLRKDLPETIGLELKVRSYVVKEKKKLFLEIVCLENDLNEPFSALVENICDRVSKGQGPFQSVSGAIDDFRELLKQLSLKAGDDEILGLLGELLQLKLLSEKSIDATMYWTGPDRKRHDFIFSGISIEVKTSQRSDFPIVVIHGLEQLQLPANGKLLLSYFRVESTPGGSLTIPGLIDELRKTVLKSELRKKLKMYGYEETNRNTWEKYSWDLIEERFYTVDMNFPKLTKDELGGSPLPGITAIQYAVNLDLAEKNRIKKEQFILTVKVNIQ